MPLITRRFLVGFLCTFAALGWLWSNAVQKHATPDSWSSGDYAGAENALSGWRASLCRNMGVCKNWGAESVKAVDPKAPVIKAPAFVLDYAPYVWLHSEEKFMPGDIGEHLMHTTPYLNYTPITASSNRALLTNLDDLNKYGDHVYLTSDDDPSNPPPWLRGDRNIPIRNATGRPDSEVGLSAAPSIIIWTEKPGGVVDAFYFYFYSFNLGNTVAGWRFGNHVGDWEHTAVRFRDGEPIEMFFSEHSGGAAFEFPVVEKIGKRPVAYSARGSHANYATSGTHYYAIPLHLLADRTNQGHLWDPAKNKYLYHYDIGTDTLTPEASNANAPTNWFDFGGRWGDRFYPLSDRRQYRVVGQYHYVNGPTGPKQKNLARTQVCQNEGICVVQPSLTYRLEGVNGPDDEEWPELDQMLKNQHDVDVTVEFSGKEHGGDEGEPAKMEALRQMGRR